MGFDYAIHVFLIMGFNYDIGTWTFLFSWWDSIIIYMDFVIMGFDFDIHGFVIMGFNFIMYMKFADQYNEWIIFCL